MSTALYVAENMMGANGEMTRQEVVRRVARSHLEDYVYECFLEDGRPYDQQLIEKVSRMIANAMVEQHEYEMYGIMTTN